MTTMRTMRIVPVLLLAGALAACEGASKYQGGDPDQQGAGQADERGNNTLANDTAPARPGAADPGDVSENKPD
jgi:hypothetical protein